MNYYTHFYRYTTAPRSMDEAFRTASYATAIEKWDAQSYTLMDFIEEHLYCFTTGLLVGLSLGAFLWVI